MINEQWIGFSPIKRNFEDDHNFKSEKKFKPLSSPASVRKDLLLENWHGIFEVLQEHPQALNEVWIFQKVPKIRAYIFGRLMSEYKRQMHEKWESIQFKDEENILKLLSYFPPKFLAFLTGKAIREGRWLFVEQILQRNPFAIINSQFFTESLCPFKPHTPVNWSVKEEDEVLILNLVENYQTGFPANFLQHLVLNAIGEGRWKFIQKICERFPLAFANVNYFNKLPEFDAYRQKTWTIAPEDESLIFELPAAPKCFFEHLVTNMIREKRSDFVKQILQNFPFVYTYLSEAYFRIFYNICDDKVFLLDLYYSGFEYLKENPKQYVRIASHLNSNELLIKILGLPDNAGLEPVIYSLRDRDAMIDKRTILDEVLKLSDAALEKHAEMLLEIANTRFEEAELKILMRFPNMNLEKSFWLYPSTLDRHLSLPQQYECIRPIFEKNIHHLLKHAAKSTLFFYERRFHSDMILEHKDLKKILVVFPECDLKEYTDIVLKKYKTPHQGFFDIFVTLLEHARMRNDVEYLNSYEERLCKHVNWDRKG